MAEEVAKTFFRRKEIVRKLPEEIGPALRAVLFEIADAGAYCSRSQETMARAHGLSRRTIIRAVAELVSRGWINRQSSGRTLSLTGNWDRIEAYLTPAYVQPALFTEEVEESAFVTTDVTPCHNRCDTMSQQMCHGVTQSPSLTAPLTPPPEEDGIGGVVKRFYELRRRPLPDDRQRQREIGLLAALADQMGTEVVINAVERLVTLRSDTIAGREYLAGCQVAIRGEIDRLIREREAAERQAAAEKTKRQRQAEEESRRAIEEAAWSVYEREWLGLEPEEQERIRIDVKRRHVLARDNTWVLDRMCVAAMRDRKPGGCRDG